MQKYRTVDYITENSACSLIYFCLPVRLRSAHCYNTLPACDKRTDTNDYSIYRASIVIEIHTYRRICLPAMNIVMNERYLFLDIVHH